MTRCGFCLVGDYARCVDGKTVTWHPPDAREPISTTLRCDAGASRTASRKGRE